MTYEKWEHAIIDTRWHLIKELKEAGANDKVIYLALNFYDHIACDGLRNQKAGHMFDKKFKEKYGDEKYKEIEEACCENMGYVHVSDYVSNYRDDILNKARYGYSAEKDFDEIINSYDELDLTNKYE